jgi:hypothetical protein
MNYVDPSGHVCVNNQGTDDEVAMPGNCGGAPDPNWNGQVTPSPSGWTGGDDSEEISVCSSSICNPNSGDDGPYIGPLLPQNQNENGASPNFGFYTEGYTWLGYLDDAFTFVENYGRPAYKHIKGVIPAGFRVEFLAGFVVTGLADLNNPNLSVSQRLLRATVIGFEDGLTEAAATKVAGILAPFGAEAGGAFGMFVTFVGASYGTTRAIDTLIWAPINNTYMPGLFP